MLKAALVLQVCVLAVACLGLLACCQADYPVHKLVAPYYGVYDPYWHVNKHCKTHKVKVIDDIYEPHYHGYGPYLHGYHGFGYPGYGYHGYGSHYYGYPAHGYHGYGKHYYGFPALKAGLW
ncbi:prismalin-14-like [Schistocerca serialis cubense]|uniref:prismalin-14-like n=1 Tax=Schistocerca serialis cubense TaxID=2023355 RepID=UPI00214DF774|nr:prismalin-14-like [Schistocerca serialis cubense]